MFLFVLILVNAGSLHELTPVAPPALTVLIDNYILNPVRFILARRLFFRTEWNLTNTINSH